MTSRKLSTTLIAIVVLLSLACAGLGVYAVRQPNEIYSAPVQSTNTQVVNAVERQEQVVLLSLGIQGLAEKSSVGEVFGVRVPWTDRTQFVQYSYKAKLGIEGKDVRVTETGEHAYTVYIPDFIFIGHTDEEFKTAVEDNGVLSWTTQPLDAASTVSDVLSADKKRKDINDNRELLQDQARSFYEGIIRGVDPEAQVTMEFS
ncbi:MULTISPECIES: hypothetical protein [Corynebacterium]|uniref:hypothetical protein n=1 Tax=Corynebacterium TaxID=1716 RepID=UPI0008A58C66|nr:MULTISPECIES: hypothetical protein [Corynebacterium]MBU5654237.1 hypothetical protein [Corynebacterium aurimucosum]OFL21775.1 hypothetical protein HMPREF2781_10740 [Corynebacterium sp. HMSC062A03]